MFEAVQADQLAAGVPEHPANALIGVEIGAPGIGDDDAIERIVEEQCDNAPRWRWTVASATFRSLMSRATFEAPMIFPAASLIAETVTETSTLLPSLRKRTVSKVPDAFARGGRGREYPFPPAGGRAESAVKSPD